METEPATTYAPTPDRSTQGKCIPCGVVWHWPTAVAPLRHSLCPLCGQPMVRTSSAVTGMLHVRLDRLTRLLAVEGVARVTARLAARSAAV